MRILSLLIILFAACGTNVPAQNEAKPQKAFNAPNGKPFPAHWGQPPLRQTRDLRILPGGYGRGSGTLARWIQENLAADAKDPGRAKIKDVVTWKPIFFAILAALTLSATVSPLLISFIRFSDAVSNPR